MAERRNSPLPIQIEEIDAAWLTAALRTRAPDVTVKDFKIEGMIRGTCTKIRLSLEMDEAGQRAGIPKTVILKGGFEPHSRDWWFMHEREVVGYREVLEPLKLQSPIIYFAEFDAARGQGIIIMEDLVARGVTFCHAQKPQSFAQVARRLTALARFHAQTWDSPELKAGGRWGKLHEIAVDTRDYLTERYLVPSEWKRFVDSARGAATSVLFHDRDWMADALQRMVTISARLPHAVLHSDTHLGNLYEDPDGTPGFFDPVSDKGPVMMEISYHLACALDTADRGRWEGALVQHYLDELARNGVDAPKFDDAMQQYGAFLARGYVIFLINESHFQTEAINTAYTARYSAAMLENDTIGLLKKLT